MIDRCPLDPTPRSRVVDVAAVAMFALILMWAALWNGFPLIFPDSATYLGIAFEHQYAVDRSSFYGLILKPVLSTLPVMTGLWVAIFVQCCMIAVVVTIAARRLVPTHSCARLLPAFTLLAITTSIAWHAGQFMPDAFTGVTVLLAWLAASRDPSEAGVPALWFAAAVSALMHYTHIPLLLVVSFVTIAFSPAATRRMRSASRRGSAALVSVGAAVAILVAANGVLLGRWTLAPMAPAFLFARLTEDGLTKPWLDENCGTIAPQDLCAIRHDLPNNSQGLLWNGASPYATRIWYAPSDRERWRWVGMLAATNEGAVAARPLSFFRNSLRGAFRQFTSFQALDDECPRSCWNLDTGPANALATYRPDALKFYRASRQVNGTLPRAMIRSITTPIASVAMLLMPLLFWQAVKRRDRPVQSLLAALSVALIANAAMTGAMSDVHDRYQSRLIWLVPFAVALIVMRWRQTFRRSRISLPGLK